MMQKTGLTALQIDDTGQDWHKYGVLCSQRLSTTLTVDHVLYAHARKYINIDAARGVCALQSSSFSEVIRKLMKSSNTSTSTKWKIPTTGTCFNGGCVP